MSTETIYLPVEDRFLLAFSDLVERLYEVEPRRDAVFPVATVVSGEWIIAGEELEEMAFALTGFFFEVLEQWARWQQEREL